MLRILTASSILALAAVPAIAQQTDPMAPSTPNSTTTPAPGPAPVDTATPAPAPADPAAPAPAPADPAAPAPAAEAAPAAPVAETKESTVAKLVDAEFPTYDADSNGDLNQAEFGKWVLALHSASGDPKAAAMDEKAKAKWAKDAFASADADKNKKVSKAEINTFLLG